MRDHVLFLCRVELGRKTEAELEAEAEAAGFNLPDYVKRLVEQNIHLILGEDYRE